MTLSRWQWVILFLLVVGFIASGGIIGFVLASLLSFIPAYYYLRSIRNAEEDDIEPWSALGTAFAWGAISGVFLAGIFNALGTSLILVFLSEADSGFSFEDTAIIVGAVLVAPIVEEFVKPLVMFRNQQVKQEVDEIEDGIVYGAACGLGFGATENVLYGLSEGATAAGIAGIFVIILLRTVSSILLHLVATSYTGYGIAKYQLENEPFTVVIKYYLLAVLIHAAWNAMAVSSLVFDNEIGTGLLFLLSISLAIGGLEMAKRRIRELDVAGSNIGSNDIRSGSGLSPISNQWERRSGWEQKKLDSSGVDRGQYSSSAVGQNADALYSSDDKNEVQEWASNINWRSAIGTIVFLIFIAVNTFT
jgi:RsiW-degrading membrane proteinase PrsW (M82 family)